MSEKIIKGKIALPQYIPHPTGMTLDEYMANRAKTVEPIPTTMSVDEYYANLAHIASQKLIIDKIIAHNLAHTKPEIIEGRRPLSRRTKKVVAFTLASLFVVGGTASGYALNIGNVQSMDYFADSHASPQGGLAITPLETLGEKSLAPNQCKDPNAVLMVATVSGNLPLVPMLLTTENSTPSRAEPYLTESKRSSLPKEQQQKFGKFITKSGYPEATLNSIPLALTICEPSNANAITEQGGSLTINRSALEVSFEDPNGLFGSNVYSVPQVESASVTPDSKKSEFMSLPSPFKKMFLGQGTDVVYNKSISDVVTSMDDPKQLQVILSKMEVEAVQDLDNVVDGHKHITYPDKADTLQQAIDNALVKRLVGNAKVSPIFTGNYNTQMNVPKDAATKQPVTSNDPKTGASPLKNIDPTQKFNVTNIEIRYGSLSPPAIEPKNTPSASTVPKPSIAP